MSAVASLMAAMRADADVAALVSERSALWMQARQAARARRARLLRDRKVRAFIAHRSLRAQTVDALHSHALEFVAGRSA